jgi:large subunit ribosomal protein L17
MRKKVFGRKLSRNTNTRKALFRSLVAAMVLHGAIITTKAKAKFLQSELEKLITLSKDRSIAGRRRLSAALANDRKAAEGLYNLAQKVFLDTKGGYTRIINLPRRRGDFAEMVKMEWSKQPEVVKGAKSIKGKKGSVEKKGMKNRLQKMVGGKRSTTAKTTKKKGAAKKST